MADDPRVFVIIAAAGRSERFAAGSGPSDKLAQDLDGRAVLLHSVECFSRRGDVAGIVVVGPPEEAGGGDALAAFRDRYGATLGFHGAPIVAGSPTSRAGSVRRGLAAVADDATHVAVHDAARPGVSPELLDRLMLAAAAKPAVVPGLPIHGTVKRTGPAESIGEQAEDDPLADLVLGDAGRTTVDVHPVTETVDRRGLYEIQTPQVFAADVLRRAYAQDAIDDATDDATLVERLGEEVVVVEGDPRAMKITTPADLSLLRAMLSAKAAPPTDRPVGRAF